VAPLSEFEQINDKTNTIPHAIEPNDSKCFKIKSDVFMTQGNSIILVRIYFNFLSDLVHWIGGN
jgi:hypothetical protein